MEFKGIVKEVSPIVTGVSKAGKEWRKVEAVIETEDHYPQSIVVTQMGDLIEQQRLIKGKRVIAHLGFRANKYNGRFFNSVACWKVDSLEPEDQGFV